MEKKKVNKDSFSLEAKTLLTGDILIIYNDLEIGLGDLIINKSIVEEGLKRFMPLKRSIAKNLDYKTACKICFFMNLIKLETYRKLEEFRKKRNKFAHQSVCNQNLFECGNKSDREFIKKGKKVRKLGIELLDEIYGKLLKNYKDVNKILIPGSGIAEELYKRSGELRGK